ncbi:MAG: carboxypeptidase regulatory-like domain-containing protein [Planctomycetes bacterium]|nr:carboxypeptidase regulatory-like domain-containing protein [Planctomycetota bacterium]
MSRPLAFAALLVALLVLALVFFFSQNGSEGAGLGNGSVERGLRTDPLEAAANAPGSGTEAQVARSEQAAPTESSAPPAFVVRGTLRDGAGSGVPAEVELYLAETAPRFGGSRITPAELFGAFVEGRDLDANATYGAEPPQIFLARGKSDAAGQFALGLAARPERPLFVWVVDPIWNRPDAPRVGVPAAEEREAVLDIELSAGAALRGRVVDGEGRSLAEATVLLREVPEMRIPSGMSPESFPPPQRLARTDAEGRFAFSAVAPHGRYLLRGVHGKESARRVGESKMFALDAGEAKELPLALQAGKTLRGHVRDGDGKPVADAEVIALPAHSSFSAMEANTDPAAGRARSQADGSFALEGLLPMLHLVIAEARGHEPSRAERADLALEKIPSVEITLNAGLDLRGRVVDEAGKPVATAEVILLRTLTQTTFMASAGRPLVPRRTMSDAEGRFAFLGLEDGSFELLATSADGERGGRKSGLRKKQLANEIVLELLPFGVLEGTVVDAAGQPVPRFKIELQRRVMMGFLPATVASGEFSDRAGRFRLEGLAPGKYVLLTRVPEREVHSLPEVVVAANAEPLRIALPAVSSVSGIVVNAAGQPVAEAEVQLAGDIIAAIAREMSLVSRKAKTDEQGRFELGGLPVGELSLRATHPLHAPSAAVTVTLLPDVPQQGLRMELGIGGIVEGIVYDAEGRPEVGAAVMANHGPLQIEQKQTMTDGDGRYRIEGVAPGQVNLIALGLAGAMEAESVMSALRMQTIRIAAGQTLVVDFGEPPGQARGTRLYGTLSENGKPKKNAMILASCREEMGAQGDDAGRLRFANSDRDGGFEFKNLPPGPCSLSVVQIQDGGQSVVEFDLVVLPQPEQRHDLSLDSGTLSGRVRTPGGEGLANVQIVLMAEGVAGNEGFRAFVITNEEGRFRFEGLAEGSYRATAGGPSFFGSAQNRSARTKDGLRVVAGKELTDVDFELETGAILVGRLTDEHGKGVEGASLEARPVSQDSGAKGFFQGLSGPDGRFRVVGVEPGVATVRVTKRGYAPSERKDVLFEAGKETSLDLRIEEGVRLRVRVVDAQGAPLGNAAGRVLDASGKLVDSLISFEDLVEFAQGGLGAGLLELGSFAPGSYRVRIEVEGREAQEMAVELKRSNDGIQEVVVRFP